MVDCPIDACHGISDDRHLGRQRHAIQIQHLKLPIYLLKVPVIAMTSDRAALYKISTFFGNAILPNVVRPFGQSAPHHELAVICGEYLEKLKDMFQAIEPHSVA
jgi:hypothetical protein